MACKSVYLGVLWTHFWLILGVFWTHFHPILKKCISTLLITDFAVTWTRSNLSPAELAFRKCLRMDKKCSEQNDIESPLLDLGTFLAVFYVPLIILQWMSYVTRILYLTFASNEQREKISPHPLVKCTTFQLISERRAIFFSKLTCCIAQQRWDNLHFWKSVKISRDFWDLQISNKGGEFYIPSFFDKSGSYLSNILEFYSKGYKNMKKGIQIVYFLLKNFHYKKGGNLAGLLMENSLNKGVWFFIPFS